LSKLKNVPQRIGSEYRRAEIVDALTAIVRQTDGLTEGGIAYRDNAQSVTPAASVASAVGDFVPNSNPTVSGTVGAQVVTAGWICVASGTPGTWVAANFLTGS